MTTVIAAASAVELPPLAWSSGAKAAGGHRFDLALGDKRVNWTNNRWATAVFAQPADWSGLEGLRIAVDPGSPRSDAGVYLAVREANGCWWYHPWACELTAAGSRGFARFADFKPAEHCHPDTRSEAERKALPKDAPVIDHAQDDDQRLGLGAITAIAIGTVNPFGVGTVSFTLTTLEAVGGAAGAQPVAAVRSEGKLLEINGTAMLPSGVFGGFNLPTGAAQRWRLHMDKIIHHTGVKGGPDVRPAPVWMAVNTIGDRVRPSPRLTDAQWSTTCAAYGAAYGAKLADGGAGAFVEYWNEPYLNWSNRNRANFNPVFFDQAKAVEGGAVTLKDGTSAPFLRWTRNYEAPPWQWLSRRDWRRGRDDAGKQVSTYAPPYKGMEGVYGGGWIPSAHPPEATPDGATYTWESAKGPQVLTAFTPWHIYDETQFTFWSGRGQLLFYIDPLRAFAGALKHVAPKATVIAGWQHRPAEDRLAAWDLLYRETIDRTIDLIDGVSDHDYGGDPRRMDVNAELVAAYGVSKHGKFLHSYNTECASAADPQAAPGAAADAAALGAAADRGKYRWILRKILWSLRDQPDKMRSFAHFGNADAPPGAWFSPTGEGVALDQLMRLRGRLVAIESTLPGLVAVAAVDGSDPAVPLRPGDTPALVVALLNDHATGELPVDVVLAPPAGMRFAGPGEVIAGDAAAKPVLARATLDAAPNAVRWHGRIAYRDAVVLVIPVTGALTEAPTLVRTSYVALPPARTVDPVTPWRDRIAVPAADLAGVSRAWLRLGVLDLREGLAVVVVNGQRFPLAKMITSDNGPRLVEVPLPVGLLRAGNEVAVEVAPGRAPFTLLTVTLMTER